jgi:hypothetical protein
VAVEDRVDLICVCVTAHPWNLVRLAMTDTRGGQGASSSGGASRMIGDPRAGGGCGKNDLPLMCLLILPLAI